MDIKEINGVGKVLEEKLNKNGIFTSDDLIYCFPKSYKLFKVDNSKALSSDFTVIKGKICSKIAYIIGKKRTNSIIFYVMIDDIKLKCIAFNMDFLRFKLKINMDIWIYGKYSIEYNEFIVSNLFFDSFEEKIEVDYKLKDISNSYISKIMINIFKSMDEFNITETLPDGIIEKYKLYGIKEYILASHFPRNNKDYIQITRRRKYEELFWYSLSLNTLALRSNKDKKEPKIVDTNFVIDFKNKLPFTLTPDQEKTIETVVLESKSSSVMNRLVQGDVGCGKTIVAIASALLNIKSGYQACIMLPTELLAIQTVNNFKSFLNDYNVELVSSSVKKKQRDEIKKGLEFKTIDVVVGTHALLYEDIKFYNLGLIVIDEQHKFGVNQRGILCAKYPLADKLYMTATPIPRTLGLSTFGDLAISSIKTNPSERKEVKTEIINEDYLYDLVKILNNHLIKNEKIYIVCPMVDKSDNNHSIEDAYEYFKSRLKADIVVAHGKMSSQKRNEAMQMFKEGNANVLLATTVIEVGVDVRESTVMVILSAERFGLATLHQLRGRVGRADKKSYCFLVTKDVYSKRLEILEKSSSGFDIAEQDFFLRGPGDYFGSDQSGFINLDYADFNTDIKIWEFAKEDGTTYAKKLVANEWVNKKALEIVDKLSEKTNKIN